MKTRLGFCLFVGLVALMASGCAGTNQMYYWGDYSKSLYACSKQPSEETLQKHKVILEDIVKESTARNLRVPPGVYAELGYIYFRQNNNAEAIKYFDLEEKTYPESKTFMQRLAQAAKARDEGKNEEKPKTGENQTEKK